MGKSLVIMSRYKLSKVEIASIVSRLGISDSVKIENVIDHTLLGGFSLTYNGKMYDASLLHQIHSLKERLI